MDHGGRRGAVGDATAHGVGGGTAHRTRLGPQPAVRPGRRQARAVPRAHPGFAHLREPALVPEHPACGTRWRGEGACRGPRRRHVGLRAGPDRRLAHRASRHTAPARRGDGSGAVGRRGTPGRHPRRRGRGARAVVGRRGAVGVHGGKCSRASSGWSWRSPRWWGGSSCRGTGRTPTCSVTVLCSGWSRWGSTSCGSGWITYASFRSRPRVRAKQFAGGPVGVDERVRGVYRHTLRPVHRGGIAEFYLVADIGGGQHERPAAWTFTAPEPAHRERAVVVAAGDLPPVTVLDPRRPGGKRRTTTTPEHANNSAPPSACWSTAQRSTPAPTNRARAGEPSTHQRHRHQRRRKGDDPTLRAVRRPHTRTRINRCQEF